jgi:ribose-phosphate pyrophosphokinase
MGDKVPQTDRRSEEEREICVYSGHGHRALAAEICAHLNIPLSPSTRKKFSNDNMYVQLLESVRERDIFIIQPLVKPVSDNLLELLLLLDAARSASAKRVTAVIPYYSYSRSDKKDEPRISIAAKLVADLIKAAGANRVLTMTMHSPQVHAFFQIPVDHLTAQPVLTAFYRDRDLSDTIVVTPDMGHAKQAYAFARHLELPVAVGAKKRLTDDTVRISAIIGDVQEKRVILFDDEVATAGSVVEAVSKLREADVTEVSLCCTHGVFSGPSIERLKATPEIQEIVTTNTVPIPREKRVKGMHVVSVAPLFAEAIRRIHSGESMSSLFEY